MNFDELIEKLKEDLPKYSYARRIIDKLVKEYKASNNLNFREKASNDNYWCDECNDYVKDCLHQDSNEGKITCFMCGEELKGDWCSCKASNDSHGSEDSKSPDLNVIQPELMTAKGSDNVENFDDGICIHGNFGTMCEDCNAFSIPQCVKHYDCKKCFDNRYREMCEGSENK